MGSEFKVGGTLRVKAITIEGVESEEKEARFVIMNQPDIASIFDDLTFSLFPSETTFSYKVPSSGF